MLDSINKRIDVEEMGGHVKDVFVAKEKVVDVRGGEKKVSTKKLFPGYVFIHMQLRDEDRKTISEPLNFIKDTPGAIGFVGGDQPEPTPDAEIEDILAAVAQPGASTAAYLLPRHPPDPPPERRGGGRKPLPCAHFPPPVRRGTKGEAAAAQSRCPNPLPQTPFGSIMAWHNLGNCHDFFLAPVGGRLRVVAVERLWRA